MKKLLIILVFLLPFLTFGQTVIHPKNVRVGTSLGIGVSTINGSTILELVTDSGGLGLPNLTTVERDAITLPKTGLFIYNETASAIEFNTGTPGAPVWASVASGTTIYTGDASTTGNRIVTLGANTLDFTTTVIDGFTVDGTTFSVDGNANRVGIGIAAPSATLDLVGTFQYVDGNESNNFVLTTDASGNGTWQVIPTQATETWATTLSAGAATSGTNPSVSTGDSITFNNGGFTMNLVEPTLAGDIVVTGPSSTGTLALTSDIPAATDIYAANGSLAGNRTVTQASNDLTFSTTGDANALVIDGGAGVVSIGVAASATEKLLIRGDNSHNALRLEDSSGEPSLIWFAKTDKTLMQLFTGLGSSSANVYFQVETNTTNTFFRDNLGIGTQTPAASVTLYVEGVTSASGAFGLQVQNSSGTSNTLVVRDDVKVGIGVAAPVSGLDIQLSMGWQTTNTAVSINSAGDIFIFVTDNTSQRTITIDTDDIVDGRIIVIKDKAGTASSSGNPIIVATEGAETIDGVASINITADFGVLRLVSDGTNLFTW